MKKKGKHDTLVERLFNELKDLHYVDWIKKNVTYKYGECDLLLSVNNQLIYYEVKSNHHSKAYNKGKDQIDRFKRYNPGSIGVYYTPQHREVFI